LTYLERRKCYGLDKKILFKKQLFDLEVKGQGPTHVITVRDTPPYGHAPTYQISLTYLERQKSKLCLFPLADKHFKCQENVYNDIFKHYAIVFSFINDNYE
jgi:hypothetical protein